MPITEEFVKHLMEQNKVMAEQISQLTKTVENLNQTIQKLQEQLNASHQAKKTGGDRKDTKENTRHEIDTVVKTSVTAHELILVKSCLLWLLP